MSPIADLTPPDHVFPAPHMYFYTKNDATPNDIEAPVYAPGNIVVTSIALRNYGVLNDKTNYTDYTLSFGVCDGLEGYFHHVRSLTHPDLTQALRAQGCTPMGPGNEKFCSFPVRVPIAAGVQMATTGDRAAGVSGLDMGMRDYRLATGRSAFANAERWCKGTGPPGIFEHCYTVCLFDYVSAVERDRYLGLFTDFSRSMVRTDQPRCGDFYTDRAGTAQGRWYSAANAEQFSEAPHLYIGPSALSGSVYAFSMGTSVTNVRARQYLFIPQASGLVNRRFDTITDGQVYCYERFYDYAGDALANRTPASGITILAQLTNNGQRLAISAGPGGACGSGPWTMANAATFER
ncbi:MAG: hypothetical protein FJ039_06355 [Chloroflexi bacterium]|nr:hypothetical protein [Chloroflexota bacterium]